VLVPRRGGLFNELVQEPKGGRGAAHGAKPGELIRMDGDFTVFVASAEDFCCFLHIEVGPLTIAIGEPIVEDPLERLVVTWVDDRKKDRGQMRLSN
jgi:hypothetical protein